MFLKKYSLNFVYPAFCLFCKGNLYSVKILCSYCQREMAYDFEQNELLEHQKIYSLFSKNAQTKKLYFYFQKHPYLFDALAGLYILKLQKLGWLSVQGLLQPKKFLFKSKKFEDLLTLHTSKILQVPILNPKTAKKQREFVVLIGDLASKSAQEKIQLAEKTYKNFIILSFY